jgi:hypothetical protein
MRIIVAALVLAAACGEVSQAGVSLDGQAGSGGATGAGGDAGSSGSAGGGGGSGADAQAPSCAIPIGQISGTDPAASMRSSGGSACQNWDNQVVPIVNGVVTNYVDAAGWAFADLTVTPAVAAPGMCDASIRYEQTKGSCLERLFVHLAVPAI